MPSEKRRQRQRVRHEAGDSVTSDTNSTNERKEGGLRTECKSLPTGVVAASLKTSSVDSTCELKAELNDSKRDFNISKEKISAYKNKSSNKGGNQGRRDGHQVQIVGKISHTHSVAYEDEKEYEPVKIMPSSDVSENEASNMKKFRRRDVISNWLRYEELPPEDFTEDGEDYLVGEDFSTVLKLHGNASAGGFLHLKGEMSWGEVNPSHLGMHGLGALKVADLAAALATIPLHQQLKIPEESLPLHDIQMYIADAETHKKSYQPDKEYVTDIDINEGILKNLKLSMSDTFTPTEDAVHDDQVSLDANEIFASAIVRQSDNGGNEVSQENRPTLKMSTDPAANKFINDNEVEEDCSELKPDQVPLVNNVTESIESEIGLTVCIPKSDMKETCKEEKFQASSFNFGLPLKMGNECVIKKPVDCCADLNVGVEPEVITKNESQANEIVDPTVSWDSKVEGGNTQIEIPDPKVKDTFTLVSKAEMESLEDWLDSILDD